MQPKVQEPVKVVETEEPEKITEEDVHANQKIHTEIEDNIENLLDAVEEL